ncbi:MAG: ABC transporter ATP-binding protein [Gammaproteobacteria bacterium]|nr:ABC transporter ATP-binding protein [Gammaproteobacteria bacterium]
MTPCLQANGLDVAMAGRRLITGLELDFAPGQCWALLGQNGTGKTTLLHTLAGLRAAAAGKVQYAGRPLGAWRRRLLARHVGLLPQDTADPFPATVLETALLGRHPHRSAWSPDSAADLALARAALATVDLAGLESRSVARLSGGERRRLAIATLLTQDPAVLLLDEPFNHLDLRHTVGVLTQLRALAVQGRCVLMSLHDPNLAVRGCDHTLLLYGDGHWAAGGVTEMLTEENLGRLYGYPVKAVAGPHGPVFVAA